MKVYELNGEQMNQLKQQWLCDHADERGGWPTWGELAWADELVGDADIYAEWGGTEFCAEDFFAA